MTSPKRHPPHLWTLEFNLGSVLPILFHHYPTEAEARQDFFTATKLMNRPGATILGLALYHRHTLQSSAVPAQAPAPRPLPPPSPDGITRLPARSRALSPSSQFFRSADLVILDESEVRI